MFWIFGEDNQKQNKDKEGPIGRGLSWLRSGSRKSDTQELDPEEIRKKQAALEAQKKTGKAERSLDRAGGRRQPAAAEDLPDIALQGMSESTDVPATDRTAPNPVVPNQAAAGSSAFGQTAPNPVVPNQAAAGSSAFGQTASNPVVSNQAAAVSPAFDIGTQALQAQADPAVMETFIADQRPFIRASAARALGRFVTESDDEYMTAMEAFHEAVLKYEPDRGAFPAFAGVVIKRRILDQYRRRQKFSPETPVDGAIMDSGPDLTDGDGMADPVALRVQEQVAAADPNRIRDSLRMEIGALQQILEKYGFGFAEMKESAPKSVKTRESCRAVSCLILQEGMLPQIRLDRHLPMRDICEALKISSKKIERHRKYIIAVCEILDGDFPHLSEFLGETRARLRESSQLYRKG